LVGWGCLPFSKCLFLHFDPIHLSVPAQLSSRLST
jgi:hypothetical protein